MVKRKVMRWASISIGIIFVLSFDTFIQPQVARAANTSYYVSATGNDNNSGTTQDAAWQSISKVNGTIFGAGDRILFEGGKSFLGTVELDGSDNGSSGSSILIGSYGTGRATINGGNGTAIKIDHSQYVKVNNINVVGSGRKNANINGRGIDIINGRNIDVQYVDASGFQWAGVSVVHGHSVYIMDTNAHDNGDGVRIDWCGYNKLTDDWNTDIYMCNVYMDNNPGNYSITDNVSGTGLQLLSTDGGKVEYCEASNNGSDCPNSSFPGGPAGMIAWDVNNVTFQNLLVHDQKSNRQGVNSSDGCALDIDGDNSITQYCYTYNNYGPGYLSWNFIKNQHNVLRYYISEGDGYVPSDGHAAISIGYAMGDEQYGTAGDMFYFDVYNCSVYSTQSAVRLRSSKGANTKFSGLRFMNNIFYSSKNFAYDGTWDANFNGNCYYSADGQFNVDGCTGLPSWRTSKGKEMLSGSSTGIYADPKYVNPGNGEKLTSPTLENLTGYKLQTASPCINSGLNLNSKFGITVGTRDFWGTSLPQGSGYEIGAYEGVGVNGGGSGINLVANPGFESDGATQTPTGWLEWSDNSSVDASFTDGNFPYAGSYIGIHYKTTAYRVSTYQNKTGLTNGLYTLKAVVCSSGGQTEATLFAQYFGGTSKSYDIRLLASYTSVTIPDINVTNGTCQIGLWSDSPGGKWMSFDNVEFYKQ